MSFRWLKHYMPRSLYGRAALILVMPIVVLQLVVSVAFIQNHLEDIITQMTQTVVREIQAVSSLAAELTDHGEVLDVMAPILPASPAISCMRCSARSTASPAARASCVAA